MYCELANLRGALVEQIVACTATADRRTLAEVQSCLGLQRCVVVSMPIARCNASIFITRKHYKSAEANLVRTLRRSTAQQVLLLCRKKDETERMAAALQSNEIAAAAYHSDAPDRDLVMQSFDSGMVDTCCCHSCCHLSSHDDQATIHERHQSNLSRTMMHAQVLYALSVPLSRSSWAWTCPVLAS